MTSVAVPAPAPPTRRQLRELERAREAAVLEQLAREARVRAARAGARRAAEAEALRAAEAEALTAEQPAIVDSVAPLTSTVHAPADELDLVAPVVDHLPMGSAPNDHRTERISVLVSRRELRTRGQRSGTRPVSMAPRAAILTSLGVLTIAAPLTGFVAPSGPAAAAVVTTEASVLDTIDSAAAARSLEGAIPTGSALQQDETAPVRAAELASREQARTDVPACAPVEGASGMREAFTERESPVYRPMVQGTFRDTSFYGPRWGAFHSGTDMAAPLGTPIYAVAAGTVVHAGGGKDGRSGQLVIIQHVIDGKDVWTWYGHMYTNGVHVSAGERVEAGQMIASIGNNGYSTGPHLHFEVHTGEYGNDVNPLGWLAGVDAVYPGTC
ncbi:MAG: M23 family metallopeptidase [Actinomycetota bacterium]